MNITTLLACNVLPSQLQNDGPEPRVRPLEGVIERPCQRQVAAKRARLLPRMLLAPAPTRQPTRYGLKIQARLAAVSWCEQSVRLTSSQSQQGEGLRRERRRRSIGCLAGSGELIGGQRILDQQDCGRSARSHSQGGQGPVRASQGDRCLQQAAMNWRG
jgi:hypothetical protein